MRRRDILTAIAAWSAAVPVRGIEYPAVTPRPLVFPRDHGAHPDYRIEWWYLTGWLDAPGQASIGFQLTFFRSRTDIDPANPSAFAAKQLVIAHVAIADPARGALQHDDRLARAGFGAASAATEDTDVQLGRWRLWRQADGSYRTSTLTTAAFSLELEARPTQPILLQGIGGYSRKGPDPSHASYYYSQPGLEVRARITRGGRSEQRLGIGWLDHEWSSTVLAPDAAGWDWVGMNLDDGGALTAFAIRPRTAGSPLIHAYATLRPRGGPVTTFGPDQVRFEPVAEWISPRTRARWPVAQRLRVGSRQFTTLPLMNDQELDSRRTSGTVYWEGASRLLEAERPAGRGYLEMTGYVAPIRL